MDLKATLPLTVNTSLPMVTANGMIEVITPYTNLFTFPDNFPVFFYPQYVGGFAFAEANPFGLLQFLGVSHEVS